MDCTDLWEEKVPPDLAHSCGSDMEVEGPEAESDKTLRLMPSFETFQSSPESADIEVTKDEEVDLSIWPEQLAEVWGVDF